MVNFVDNSSANEVGEDDEIEIIIGKLFGKEHPWFWRIHITALVSLGECGGKLSDGVHQWKIAFVLDSNLKLILVVYRPFCFYLNVHYFCRVEKNYSSLIFVLLYCLSVINLQV